MNDGPFEYKLADAFLDEDQLNELGAAGWQWIAWAGSRWMFIRHTTPRSVSGRESGRD